MESLPPMDDPNAPQQSGTKKVPKERTGCVTLYVYASAFTLLTLPLSAIYGFMVGAGINGFGLSMPLEWALLLIVVAFTSLIFSFLYLRGLWQMRNWARVLTIVLHGIFSLVELLQLIYFLSIGFVPQSCSIIGGILVSVGIMVWFAVNGNKFD